MKMGRDERSSRSICRPEERSDDLNVLVIADRLIGYVGTIADHLSALKSHSRHDLVVVDFRTFKELGIPLERFDVVVIHYSLILASETYIPADLGARLAAYPGLKVAFIQDEYRWIDRTAASLARYGFHVLFSVINQEAIDRVYHHPNLRGLRKEITLTGFVPEALARRAVPEYAARPIDVGYRARKVPAWLGSFALEKFEIGQRFAEDASRYDLVCDIEHQEAKRIYGEAWINFVSNCKAMLGTESGASVCDFTGEVQQSVEAYEARNPHATFDDLRRRFFMDRDGDTIIRVISPRCFEAAALRTLMILYPGTYSGRLEAWRHYVPLARDHSNMDEVVSVLNDADRATEIIENAYNEVALEETNTFRAMAAHFDAVIGQEAANLPFRREIDIPNFKQIENKENRILRKYEITLKIKRIIYSSVNWTFRHLLPQRTHPTALSLLRALSRRQFKAVFHALWVIVVVRSCRFLIYGSRK